jgi:hypothetical protein
MAKKNYTNKDIVEVLEKIKENQEKELKLYEQRQEKIDGELKSVQEYREFAMQNQRKRAKFIKYFFIVIFMAVILGIILSFGA